MANKGFGQFAGSFAEAFSRTVGQSEDKKRRDELAKQQAKLVEMQLAAGQVKLDAQTTLAELMTGTPGISPTVTSPGGRTSPNFVAPPEGVVGEFTQGRDAVAPMDLASILSDPEGQLAAVQSGALNIGDLLDFQSAQAQLDARPDLGGLFGRVDSAGNSMLIPSGLTIDPQGRPSQQFSLNPEFNTKQDEAFSGLSFNQLVSDTIEVADIEGVLTETFSESGFPFAEEATAGKLVAGKVLGSIGFGGVEAENKQDAAKRERARKLYGLILNSRLNKLMETDPNLSITQIEQQKEISPSVDKPGPANILLLADFMQEELNKADIEGTPISSADRKKALDFIRKARSGGFSETPSPVIIDVPAIAKMTLEQLEGLDVEALTQEQIDAVRARLSALK